MFDPQSRETIAILNKYLVEHYSGMGQAHIDHLRSGINHTYRVSTDNQQYILRIYHPGWRIIAAINDEAHLLLQLVSNNVPVSYPVADNNLAYVQTISIDNTEVCFMLFTYAPGKKIKNQSPEQHFRNGFSLSSMHTAYVPAIKHRTDYRNSGFLEQALKDIFNRIPPEGQNGKIIAEAATVATAFLDSAQSLLPYGLLHLDFWADNMHITESGAVTMFDFDFCGIGYFSMDIAYYLLQLRAIEGDTDQYNICKDGFIQGYQKVRVMLPEENNSIRPLSLALLLFYLGVQCKRTDWSAAFLTDDYIQTFIDSRIRPALTIIS